jgi:hypothetical protein
MFAGYRSTMGPLESNIRVMGLKKSTLYYYYIIIIIVFTLTFLSSDITLITVVLVVLQITA